MAYLDDTGLAYFWGKIKAWANSVFALLGHTHPASDVTLMTGYSKPASGSAVAASDTLNQAVGKLEAKVDDALDDSGYVHLTGNEDISDFKTFQNANIRVRDVTKGTAPSSTVYNGLYVQDSSYDADSGDNWGVHRIGAVEFSFGSDNVFGAFLLAYANISNVGTGGRLAVFYDTNNSVAYATAPSTLDTRNDGEDIVTRNWIPKDTRIVHTTGDETVGGKKTFEEDVFANRYIYIRHGSVQVGTPAAASYYRDLSFVVRNATGDGWERVGVLEKAWYSNGGSRLVISNIHYVDTSKPGAEITVGHTDTGIPYTQAITPPSDSNSRDIATTAWTNSKYVNLTSAQTIAGDKTFTTGITLANTSPIIKNKDTNGEKGNASAGWSVSYGFYDKNDKVLGLIHCSRYGASGDKHNVIALRVYKCNSASDTEYGQVFLNYYTSPNIAFEPESTDTIMLGRSTRKWKEVWCTQSSINSSSDERLKDDIESVPDAVLDAWLGVDWVQYRFKSAKSEKGEEARFHTGAVAQRIDEAFRGAGLDASRYGLFLHDVWDAVPDAFDENGMQLQKAQPAGDEYGLRYVEALCMEAACMRRENARLKKRVADLEDRLAALELRLGSE